MSRAIEQIPHLHAACVAVQRAAEEAMKIAESMRGDFSDQVEALTRERDEAVSERNHMKVVNRTAIERFNAEQARADKAEARAEALRKALLFQSRAWRGLEQMPYECGPGGEQALRSLGKRMAERADATLKETT